MIRVQTVRELTPAAFTPVFERLTAEGLGSRSVNIYIGVVKRVFTWATDVNLIARNPLEKLKGLKEIKRRHRRALSEEEIGRLLAACPYDLGVFVTFIISTGLRKGEARGLEWRDLDLETGVVTVRAEIAKAKRERTIPLRGDTVEQIKEWRCRHPDPSDHSPVFVTRRGNRIGADLNRTFRHAVGRAGIDPAGVDVHSMRYVFASRLCRAGVSPKIAQVLLGHRDINMTMNLYTTVESADKRRAVDALLALPGAAAEGGDATSTPAKRLVG